MTRHLRTAIAFATILLLAACASGERELVSSEAAAFKVAEAARTTGDFATAVRLYPKVIAADEANPAHWVGFGLALFGNGQLEEATSALDKALQLQPGRVDAHIGLGQVYLARRKPNQATIEFDAALQGDPSSVRALNGKGVALDMLGRHEEAQAAYRSALALAPDDKATRNNLGLSLALGGKYDEAVQILSVLVLEPGATARNRQNLALALGLRGDNEGAAKVSRRDLDETVVLNNLRWFEAARSLAPTTTTR